MGTGGNVFTAMFLPAPPQSKYYKYFRDASVDCGGQFLRLFLAPHVFWEGQIASRRSFFALPTITGHLEAVTSVMTSFSVSVVFTLVVAAAEVDGDEDALEMPLVLAVFSAELLLDNEVAIKAEVAASRPQEPFIFFCKIGWPP